MSFGHTSRTIISHSLKFIHTIFKRKPEKISKYLFSDKFKSEKKHNEVWTAAFSLRTHNLNSFPSRTPPSSQHHNTTHPHSPRIYTPRPHTRLRIMGNKPLTHAQITRTPSLLRTPSLRRRKQLWISTP